MEKIVRSIWNRNKDKRAPGTRCKTKDKAVIAFGAKLKAGTTSKGVAVILPSDPNALVERLNLRIAAYKAGNTGVADEAITICDELLRQGVIDTKTYKAMITQLNRL